jgi:hypothetical protein
VPLWRTLRRGPTLLRRLHCCRCPPRAVPERVAVGVSVFWVLDLRLMGPLLHTRASPMASPEISTSSDWFRAAPDARVYTRRWRTGARGSTRHCFFFPPPSCSSGFSLYFGFAFLYLGYCCVGFEGCLGVGGFFCRRGLLYILGFIVSWGILLYLGCLMEGFF